MLASAMGARAINVMRPAASPIFSKSAVRSPEDVVLQQTFEFGSGYDGCHSLLFARVHLQTTLSEPDKMRRPAG